MTSQFNSVKVFSATMVAERDRLGETVTEWIRANPSIEIIDMVTTQSSDDAFHCIAITVFFNTPKNTKLVNPPRPEATQRRRVP